LSLPNSGGRTPELEMNDAAATDTEDFPDGLSDEALDRDEKGGQLSTQNGCIWSSSIPDKP